MQEYRPKVVLCGEPSVGKTSILRQSCEHEFISEYIPSLGVDFARYPITLGQYDVNLCVFDTAGKLMYRSHLSRYIRCAAAIVLVYDISRRETFNTMETWVEDTRTEGTDLVCIVGNKVDKTRVVSYEEGKLLSDAVGAVFIETTATRESSTTALFTLIANMVLRRELMTKGNVGSTVGEWSQI